MPRFFIDKERIENEHISIIGEDAHHIARSLRMAVGDELTVCDMEGNEYSCAISSFEGDREVITVINSVRPSDTESPVRITLFQALPKGDKLDSIIQKSVECGVDEIVPFQSERCIVRIKSDTEQKKSERRQKIAEEAAKQCGRGIIPKIARPIEFEDALKAASQSELCLFCYEGTGTEPIGKILREMGHIPKSISIVVGSEGGFSEREAEIASSLGLKMTGLGKRILRTETASPFVLACIACTFEL